MKTIHQVKLRVTLDDLIENANTDDMLLITNRNWRFEDVHVYNAPSAYVESYVEVTLTEIEGT